VTDREFLTERDALLADLAATWRARGATPAQMLKLFPPAADDWVDCVDAAFAAPADVKPRAAVGARDRIVRCIDATERRPLTWFGQDRTDMLDHRGYLQSLAGDDLRKLEAAHSAPPPAAEESHG
jgi:hypothetical protein